MSVFETFTAIELEEVVIGAILIDKKAFKNIENVLFEDVFYDIDYKTIFRICKNLNDEMTGIDIKILKHKLIEDNLFNSKIEMKMLNATLKVSSSAHIEFHSRILLQKYARREISIGVDELKMKISSPSFDIFKAIDENRLIVSNIDEKLKLKKTSSVDIISEEREKYIKTQNGEIMNIKTSITGFDKLGGWTAPEFSIFAGRPSMGKTSIILAISKASSFDYDKKGLFVSLEMTRIQLINRLAASILNLDYSEIRARRLNRNDFERLIKFYEFFEKDSNLIVKDATDSKTLDGIKRAIEEHKPDYVIIDYLQLVKISSKSNRNREQEVSEISRSLKLFCLEFQIPIIALSQLSRALEQRQNKRPIMSDLRESGSLEQDADNVIFIYRDAYYRRIELGVDGFIPKNEEGNFEFIIRKGREIGLHSFACHIDFMKLELSNDFKYGDSIDMPDDF